MHYIYVWLCANTYVHVQLCANVLHDVQLCANALHDVQLCANEKRITNQKTEQGELEAVILQKNFKNMKQTKTEH